MHTVRRFPFGTFKKTGRLSAALPVFKKPLHSLRNVSMEPNKSPGVPAQNSPSIAWGSPALRPTASFPPTNRSPNVMTPPHRPPGLRGSRSLGPGIGMGTGSPQTGYFPFPNVFQTPQPQQTHRSPFTPRPPWSDNRGQRAKHRFSESPGGSPRGSPSVNPGGSDDIRKYYHPSMVGDPWFNTPPRSVDYWKKQ